jgi:EpsI family protein
MNANRRKATLSLGGMLLACGAAVLARPTRVTPEMLGGRVDLEAKFPRSFGTWTIDPTVRPLQVDPVLQRVVEEAYDQVVSRTYRNAAGYRVMLSAAYSGRRDQSMDIHRPEVCYPAQGLSVRRDTWATTLVIADRELPLKRLVAGNGQRNEPISYWLVIGRDLASFGYGHRLATLKYGLTGRVPDGMLVRVSSVDADEARSFAMQEAFLIDLMAAVDDDFRGRLFGAL